MFMSMGEPMLNWQAVESAIVVLHNKYANAELLVSTVGIKNDKAFAGVLECSRNIKKVGLQFSIHKSTNEARDTLIPYRNKWNLEKIRDAGLIWWKETGRKPYLNYCIDGVNNTGEDFIRLRTLFSPAVFNFTFSVVCSKDETAKDSGYRNLDVIREFEEMFIHDGYSTRVFDPAGQDDIGGGCGMLWYVQEWMKNHKRADWP